MDEQGRDDVEDLDLEPVATVRNRRPPVLWAVLAVVAVVAGAALVVTSADDDGNPRPGLPVDLASQTAGGEAAAADSSMRAWVTYVAGDDLPALGGQATAYRLSGDVDEADVRALADALGIDGAVETDGASSWWVAGEGGLGRLDVYAGSGASWTYAAGYRDCVDADGSVGGCCDPGAPCTTFDSTGVAIGGGSAGQSSSAGSSGSGSSSACDGSTPECSVTTLAPNPADSCTEATDDVEVDCAARPSTPPDCPPDANCITLQVCSEPDGTESTCPDDTVDDTTTATANVWPLLLAGEDEAKAAALEVVAASGADVDGARVTAESGDESRTWFVTVEPVIDGIPTGLVSYVEVSEDAVVTSGNGFFGQPEALGEYPLLDTRAVVDRANSQSGVGIEPALGDADDAVSRTTGGDEPTTTVVTGAAICEPPEGPSEGCNDVGVAEEPPTTMACKAQPDGREICEVDPCAQDGSGPGCELSCEDLPAAGRLVDCAPDCPQAAATEDTVVKETVPAEDPAVGAPETIDCAPPHPKPGEPPVPDPIPEPEPHPLEVVLVDAEPSLVLLAANDGSADAYLVPAYRFTAEDGSTVDLPAVADEALAGPATTETTETTVPDTVVPEPVPVPEPQPCVLTEQDPATETTHTIQTCPPSGEKGLEIGGEGYYVDIDLQCAGGSFELGGQIWVAADDAVAEWADAQEQFEGGIFTLDTEDHGTFVGDAAETKVAEFRTLGPAEDIFCTPEPRP